jgi:2,3-bisphosphoglycerate-dependent phosphoglycerate mutase
VGIELVFETHSTTEDNEQGLATGWFPGCLSEAGREQAAELGRRRRDDGLAAVFSSDLARAVQTTSIAFADCTIPVLLDWRLRECDYGARNGAPAAELHADRLRYLDVPHPRGESWRGAVRRVDRFLKDLLLLWDSARVLVIGHVATRWALDHVVNGIPLEQLTAEQFQWQPGWEFRINR